MNVRAIVFLLATLAGSAFAWADDLRGIYVNKEHPYYRVEFAADGRYFGTAGRGEEGTFGIEGDSVTCQIDDEVSRRFKREGITLIDDEGNTWVPREEIHRFPWKDASPVTIVVLDQKTKKPIPHYGYEYSIKTPTEKYDPLWVRPIEVQSEKGEFVIQAPESCEIDVRVRGGGIVGGYGRGGGEYELSSKNKERRIEVPVEVGVTVEGVVVEAKTGKPVKDAMVSPTIFTPPLFTPDRSRSVKTDAEGKFKLPGVESNLGIDVWHYDYLSSGAADFEKSGEKLADRHYRTRIEMEMGERLVGTVKDPAGKPLAGVAVSDGAGKGTRTGENGEFVLMSPRRWGGEDTYNLTFDKEGYLKSELKPKEADLKGFAIILRPMPVLSGQVLDPAGKPVKIYGISAGVGREPRDWCCTSDKIDAADGRFSLQVNTGRDYDKEGIVWVGVVAPGFAPWETTVNIWEGTHELTVRLANGVTVRGSVEVPKGYAEEITATLLPVRVKEEEMTNETSERQEMGRAEATVDRDGAFRFGNVAAGKYLLAISGARLKPISTGIDVTDKELDLGAFHPAGTGSISGLIYEAKMICEGDTCRLDEKRGPWAFAEGEIFFADTAGRSNENDFHHLKPIPFKADESGRFHVDGVPEGEVTVSIPYHATADIISRHSRTAQVVAGKTTEVRFYDTSGDWDVKCTPIVGDGSAAQFLSGTGMATKRKVGNVTNREPMLHLSLTPLDDAPGSFSSGNWNDLGRNESILLRDVQPGKYRLTVLDWQGSIGMTGKILEKDVEVVSGGTKLEIPLGAGSITGEIKWKRKYRYMIHVIAVGANTHAIGHAHCDDENNFCTRYLPADEYTLYAHDYDAGWQRLGKTSVNGSSSEIGVHELTPGGTIAGKVAAQWAEDMSVSITATDSQGFTIENPNLYKAVGEEYSISNLWPGKWTVKLSISKRVIAEKAVEIKGTERVQCDFEK